MFRPLPSGQFATKSRVMTMFFFLPLVALILSFNGVAGILGVTLYLSGGNPQPAIIILLVLHYFRSVSIPYSLYVHRQSTYRRA